MAAAYKAINNGVTVLGAAAGAQADVNTDGFNWLTVAFRIGNATTPATAATDINGGVSMYEDDGVTAVPPNGAAYLTPDLTVRAQTLAAPYAFLVQRYNVAGMTRVRVNIVNNNAGGLQGATAVVFLGGELPG